MTRFAKFALSGLTALSITLAPLPSAAAPDGEDVIKTIAGLAVLGIIANQIGENDNKLSSTNAVTATNAQFRPREQYDNRRVIEGTIRPYDHWDNRRGARRAKLPNRCLLIVDTDRRDRLVYGQRCLSKNYIYARQLPDRCRLIVRDGHRSRAVYGARCLSRDGWRVAGR